MIVQKKALNHFCRLKGKSSVNKPIAMKLSASHMPSRADWCSQKHGEVGVLHVPDQEIRYLIKKIRKQNVLCAETCIPEFQYFRPWAKQAHKVKTKAF